MSFIDSIARCFSFMRPQGSSLNAGQSAVLSGRQVQTAPSEGFRAPAAACRPPSRSLLSRIVATVAPCFGFRAREAASEREPGPASDRLPMQAPQAPQVEQAPKAEQAPWAKEIESATPEQRRGVALNAARQFFDAAVESAKKNKSFADRNKELEVLLRWLQSDRSFAEAPDQRKAWANQLLGAVKLEHIDAGSFGAWMDVLPLASPEDRTSPVRCC
jgi:hypothetical protein